MELWIVGFLTGLGNKLGKNIIVDDSFKDYPSRLVARILVDINTWECLLESVDLVLGGKTHTQVLDDKNVPFICVRCHHNGHTVIDYTKSF